MIDLLKDDSLETERLSFRPIKICKILEIGDLFVLSVVVFDHFFHSDRVCWIINVVIISILKYIIGCGAAQFYIRPAGPHRS